jgi:hypothetical protein
MLNPIIVTQKTPKEQMAQIVLSDKSFLVSKTVEEQLILMSVARDYYVKYNAASRVVKELQANQGLSIDSAWSIANITPRIYAIFLQPLTRDFLVDIHLEKIEETRRIAREMGDAKSMAMCDKNRHAAIEKFCGTKELINQSELHLPDVEVGFHPELFKVIPDINSLEYMKIIEGFKKRKVTQKRLEEAEDTDYEEITPSTEDNE